MKRRKNAVYTGKSKRSGAGIGDRAFVGAFYKHLNDLLRPEDEIEIIPPEQVNPTLRRQKQCFIMADYCVRKIVPEVTSLFAWGDEVTPRLRALAPIVNKKTAKAAYEAANAAANAADAAHRAADAAAGDSDYPADVFFNACRAARDAYWVTTNSIGYSIDDEVAAKCVYYALVTCVEAGDEAAYDRIIDLTNEMLESL